MTFVSLTRLRIRSVRFVPLFALHTWRSMRQVKHAPGFQTGAILADRSWTFWTMTAWDDQESMRQFMASGSHKTAMPHASKRPFVEGQKPKSAAYRHELQASTYYSRRENRAVVTG